MITVCVLLSARCERGKNVLWLCFVIGEFIFTVIFLTNNVGRYFRKES